MIHNNVNLHTNSYQNQLIFKKTNSNKRFQIIDPCKSIGPISFKMINNTFKDKVMNLASIKNYTKVTIDGQKFYLKKNDIHTTLGISKKEIDLYTPEELGDRIRHNILNEIESANQKNQMNDAVIGSLMGNSDKKFANGLSHKISIVQRCANNNLGKVDGRWHRVNYSNLDSEGSTCIRFKAVPTESNEFDLFIKVQDELGEGFFKMANVQYDVNAQTLFVGYELKDRKKESKQLLQKEDQNLMKFSNSPGLLEVRKVGVPSGKRESAILVKKYEGDFRKLIREVVLLPDSTKTKMMIDLLKGLDTLHINGVVHNDIKISNIFCSPSDELAVLGDYGCMEEEDELGEEVFLKYIKSDINRLGQVFYNIQTGKQFNSEILNQFIADEDKDSVMKVIRDLTNKDQISIGEAIERLEGLLSPMV